MKALRKKGTQEKRTFYKGEKDKRAAEGGRRSIHDLIQSLEVSVNEWKEEP